MLPLAPQTLYWFHRSTLNHCLPWVCYNVTVKAPAPSHCLLQSPKQWITSPSGSQYQYQGPLKTHVHYHINKFHGPTIWNLILKYTWNSSYKNTYIHTEVRQEIVKINNLYFLKCFHIYDISWDMTLNCRPTVGLKKTRIFVTCLHCLFFKILSI